ncbi:MAG TPA: GNAT family N-acetyltransferase [Bacteroidales bacterium]|nr:MAG: GNAT family N-acetyltransferase [Bacteroidetes bacterium GWF2_33_38]HBF88719.1 GNAT family N-acetyltransferase [Bacteroidales bacterium]
MIKIEKAQRDNISKIADFQFSMAFETESLQLNYEVLKAGVEAVFNDSSKGEYFVAELDNEIIGVLLITKEWSDWRNKQVYWIQSVYVLPEHRGKGIYTLMYNHIKNIVLNSIHIAGVRLYVDKRNTVAQKVYSVSGMTNEHYELFEWMKD